MQSLVCNKTLDTLLMKSYLILTYGVDKVGAVTRDDLVIMAQESRNAVEM